MKKHLIGLLVISILTFSHCCGQSSSDYRNKSSSCENELAVLKGKQTAIDGEYDNVVAELRQGLFCSLCNRSKSQIEKGGTNFYQHIKDVKGNVVQAPTAAYEQARKEYLSKFNSWQQEVVDKQKSCEDLRTLTQNAANNEQQQIATQNQQRQQQTQEQYNRQVEQNKQQQEKVSEQLAQALKDQQLQLEANKLQQQQDFNNAVSDYVNGHSADLQGRLQAAENISQQGSILAQSIQGNNIDVNKIAPSTISGSSVFNNVPSYEDILKSNSTESNNYFEQYSSVVEEVLKDGIISQSQLPEIFKEGYEKVNTYLGRFNAGKDLINGNVTESVSEAYFSSNEAANPIITTIQKTTGGVAVKQANTTIELADKIGTENFSESDLNETFELMSPMHFSPTFVKEHKPFNFKDAAVVVGGGIILTTIAAPLWLGIGAAAWYGFNR